MDYKVSALKYRPSQFGKVIGQNQVTDTLKNSVQENKIPSAILFCGPKGVGKTTCARIYAREINKEFIQLENYDYAFNIFELDAASNRKIDDIRDLLEKVKIPPQLGKYKVYIIDEVHMLTKEAENAFLRGRYLNVNRGFGVLAFPGRVGIWPEITSITLKRSV